MKRPKEAKVGSQTYKITWTEDVVMHDGDECFGWCDEGGEITISLNASKRKQQQVLIHELFVHAIAQVFGITIPGRGKSADREEAVAERFAEPLLMLIRDNPEVIAWLRS